MSTTRGFTLVELLVALLLFSLLALAGYRGLQGVLDTRAHLAAETRKWQDTEAFFARLAGQLAQAGRRNVRLPDGRLQAALVGGAGQPDGVLLRFTRSGAQDAAGHWLTPQRIGYRLRDGNIELLRWAHLDLAPDAVPHVDVVLEGVREWRLRFLSLTNVWQDQWAGQVVNVPLPKAVEVTLLLTSGESVTRVFDLP
ncbi:MAG: hypothetical protein Fur0040_01950 [Sideroxydans sp.]